MVSAEKAYAMLGNESLWAVASRCHQILDHSSIPHSLRGGVAVCLHGYQRNTTDVVELIAIRNLDDSFARFLHPSLRPTYRELVRRAADDSEETYF
jgi:hypothetical protein